MLAKKAFWRSRSRSPAHGGADDRSAVPPVFPPAL